MIQPHHRLLTFAAAILLLAACVPLYPTPDDFPEPPWTPIVEFPTPPFPPTATPRPHTKPIFEADMQEARTFYLVLKVAIAAGDSGLVAERTQYPIQISVKGQSLSMSSPADFEENYDKILDSAAREAIYAFDEQNLVLLPDGVRAADGILWLNLFCLDAACTKSEFRITRINS